jgi:uncharacterized protein (TIGR03067 family)
MRIFTLAVTLLFFTTALGCSRLKPSATAPGAAVNSQPASGTGGQTSGSGGGPRVPNDPSAREKSKLLGTWLATDGEFQGVRMNPAGLKEMRWTFTKDKVSFIMLGKAMEATYTLQPTANPKTFEFKGPETAILGIYELQGDNLKVCCAATERPAAFATGGTSQDTLLILFHRVSHAETDK